MPESIKNVQLPPIPAKRYFTIGEVSELCGVKPHVLRYWEQEFTQLKPVKRRGNRRYYQHHEVLLIRKIRELLYEQGFTISGARNRLDGLDGEHENEAAQVVQETSPISDLQTMTTVNLTTVRHQIQEIIQLLRA
jgi:DNA-binding transcriptional MerR regulator